MNLTKQEKQHKSDLVILRYDDKHAARIFLNFLHTVLKRRVKYSWIHISSTASVEKTGRRVALNARMLFVFLNSRGEDLKQTDPLLSTVRFDRCYIYSKI